MNTVAPRRTTPTGPTPGFAAIERDYKADPALAGRILTHIRNTPRRAMVRAEAEQLVEAERRRRTSRAAAARKLDIVLHEVDDEALQAYFLLRATELRAKGFTAAAVALEAIAEEPERALAHDPVAMQTAVAEAEQLVHRAMHDSELARRLAAEYCREIPPHLIGEVDDVPTVRAAIERRDAEEARERFRHALARGAAFEDIVCESELQEQVLEEIRYERAAAAMRGGAWTE